MAEFPSDMTAEIASALRTFAKLRKCMMSIDLQMELEREGLDMTGPPTPEGLAIVDEVGKRNGDVFSAMRPEIDALIGSLIDKYEMPKTAIALISEAMSLVMALTSITDEDII